jgi:hypothetical protein
MCCCLYGVFVLNTRMWNTEYYWYICLVVQLEINIVEYELKGKFYDERNDSNFPIVNFPSICKNNPESPSYGVYISIDMIFHNLCFQSGLTWLSYAAYKKATNQRVPSGKSITSKILWSPSWSCKSVARKYMCDRWQITESRRWHFKSHVLKTICKDPLCR